MEQLLAPMKWLQGGGQSERASSLRFLNEKGLSALPL